MIHHKRKLSKDLVLSFNRQRNILQTDGQPRYALRGEMVTVVVYPDRGIERRQGEENLSLQVFDPAQPVTTPVDDKTLNACVNEILKQRVWSDKSRPAANHPWRRYPEPPLSGAGQLASPGTPQHLTACIHRRTFLSCPIARHLYFALTGLSTCVCQIPSPGDCLP